MNSDEPTPERLDALVDGGVPRTDDEHDYTALLNELRARPEVAPEALRRRVLAATEEARTGRWRRLLPRRPRVVGAALAPALAAAAVVVAVWPISGDPPRPSLGAGASAESTAQTTVQASPAGRLTPTAPTKSAAPAVTDGPTRTAGRSRARKPVAGDAPAAASGPAATPRDTRTAGSAAGADLSAVPGPRSESPAPDEGEGRTALAATLGTLAALAAGLALWPRGRRTRPR